jgi:hypothetical protein
VVDSNNFFDQCAEDSYNGFYVYYNAPLNMIILSDGTLQSNTIANHKFRALWKEWWHNFSGFFQRLFSNTITPTLNDYEKDTLSNDFYESIQGNKVILGIMENKLGEYTLLRVDYVNLTSRVTMLRDAVISNYPNANVSYVPNGSVQSIYVNVSSSYVVDWRLINSILRVNP